MPFTSPTIKQMQRHASVREFLKKPLPKGMLEAVIDAGQTAPTSSYLQPYSIIAIKSDTTKKKLATLCGGQQHIMDCPVFLVFAIDMYRNKLICDDSSKKVQTKYLESFIIAAEDTAILAQNTALAAESLGLGTVCIGGIRNEPAKVIKLLGMPKYTFPLQGLCIGYPAKKPKTRVRLPQKTVLHSEKYNRASQKPSYYLNEYDKEVVETGSLRSQGKGDTPWGEWIVRRTAVRDASRDPYILKKLRADMSKAIRAQGFDLD